MPPRRKPDDSSAPPPPRRKPDDSVAPRVTIVQVDTRDAHESVQGGMRTWPGGANHDDMHHRYVSFNPPPTRRPFWTVTAIMNAMQAREAGWRYEFVPVSAPTQRSASWVKLRHVLHHWDDFGEGETVVVLDTDAWVRDVDGFRHLLDTHLLAAGGTTLLLAAGEPVCHETEVSKSDVMNGGFLCFRKDPRVRKFLQAAWDMADTDPECHRYRDGWPWEQACLARAYRADAGGCQAWTHVLPVPTCNTPAGTHVAHCWYKDLTYDLALDDLLSALGSRLLQVKRPTVEIVVARYREDVAWVNEWIPFVERITVYDKSGDPIKSPHPKVRVVPLPNVGREGHTYAHHLHEHYDDLCDAVVCTQGRYDDHMTPADFANLVKGREHQPANGLDVPWWSAPMRHFGWTVDHNYQTGTMQPMQPAGMSMAKYFITHVGVDIVPEGELRWWMGAIFHTTAAAVRRHPRERYAAIRDSLAAGSNPEAAHMMERCWRALLVPRDY